MTEPEIAIINESESDSSFEEDCFELANLSMITPCDPDTAIGKLDTVLSSIHSNATVTSSIRIENGQRVLLNVNIEF